MEAGRSPRAAEASPPNRPPVAAEEYPRCRPQEEEGHVHRRGHHVPAVHLHAGRNRRRRRRRAARRHLLLVIRRRTTAKVLLTVAASPYWLGGGPAPPAPAGRGSLHRLHTCLGRSLDSRTARRSNLPVASCCTFPEVRFARSRGRADVARSRRTSGALIELILTNTNFVQKCRVLAVHLLLRGTRGGNVTRERAIARRVSAVAANLTRHQLSGSDSSPFSRSGQFACT